jgi:hypothetical protein
MVTIHGTQLSRNINIEKCEIDNDSCIKLAIESDQKIPAKIIYHIVHEYNLSTHIFGNDYIVV